MAAEWPDLAELKKVLDVDGEDWDDHLTSLLSAAIDRVKADVSFDEDDDEPTHRLHGAALRAAALLQTNAADPTALDEDKVYLGLIRGSRRRFGFS